MPKLPDWYSEVRSRHPKLVAAYEALGERCHKEGPLDPKSRALVKLGIAVGARLEGALHSPARRALEVGVTLEECRHAVLLATTTIGFPAMMAALSWLEDIGGKSPRKR